MSKSIDLLGLTVEEIQELLSNGAVTSVELTEMYLANIERNNRKGLNLCAVIETSPVALEVAKRMDEERAQGRLRSNGLHGIPILIKDNIATDVELGMETTAGSTALLGWGEGLKVPGDAPVVKRLRDAGAIILGKSNLTMYSNYIQRPAKHGWSARGGQTLNPYMDSDYEGGNRPGGSSSGSAVGVASGFAAASLGTETNESLLRPAMVNLLYSIKPTVGLTPRTGVVPISSTQDTVGPICKSAYDCALLLSFIAGVDDMDEATKLAVEHAQGDYTKCTKLPYATFQGKRLGVPRAFISDPGNVLVMSHFNDIITKMRSLGATVIDPCEVESLEEFKSGIPSKNEEIVLNTDFKVDVAGYLSGLIGEGPRTLEDLIKYTDEHQDTELPAGYSGQHCFVSANETKGKDDPNYLTAKAQNFELCADKGIDYLVDKYNLDALLLPNPTGYPAHVGYPGGAAPIDLPVDGVPHGVFFYGKKWSEPAILSLMAAYEANFPKRRVPERLKD